MEEYISDAGHSYTIEEINQTAKEYNTTFEDIIKKNKLTLKSKKKREAVAEEPGKRKSVAKEDAVATVKSTASKLVKPSSVSQDNPFGKIKQVDPLNLQKLTKPKTDLITERIDTWNRTSKTKKSVVGPKDKDYGSLYVKDQGKIGDYLTSTLKTKKANETFFGVEEEEGKQTLEKLYAGIPGLTFEETNTSSGDISNMFDAVKAVYIDPVTKIRKESDILQFDIGVMNASAEDRPKLANKNADILKDFFNNNLKGVNLAKNKALREDSKLIYNKELNNSITPEFRAEVNTEFDAPDLFTPRKESYTGTNLAGGMTMGTAGGGSYIVRPYENELNSAKRKILLDNPKISKEKLDIETDKLARSLLKADAINNKKAAVAQSIIENDKSMQSKLYVGSLLANEEAVKVQNRATTQLKVAESNALTLQGLGKDSEDILQGQYKTEEEAAVIANKFKSVGIDMDINNTELITLKNGNTISRGFYDAYLKLNEAYKANNLYATQAFNTQNNNLEKLSDSDIFTTAAAKNYDLSEKYLANIGLGTTDILAGASYFTAKVLSAVTPFAYAGDEISELIYGEDAQTTSGKLDEWAVNYTKAVDDIRQSYVRDVSFEDAFSSGSNFGKFAAQEISQQIPILMAMAATGGAAGVAGVSAEGASTAMIGVFGAGGKMAQMQTEMAKGSADYSNTEVWLKSVGFGASEAMFERMTTIPILKRATNHFASFGGEDVLDTSMKAYFKSKTPGFVFDQFLESAGETGTAITQNIIDGRPVMENVAHAGFSGFGMGTVMSGVPYMHGLYISAFSDYNSKQEIRTLTAELKDLGRQFELTKKRAPKKALAGLKQAKQQEINIAIEKQQSKINENLRSGSAQKIISIENDKAKLQNEAKAIVDDKSIDSDLKEILIKDLRTKFNKLNNIKETALNPVNLMQDKSKFILLEASEPNRYEGLISQATTNLSNKENITEEIIKKEAYELYLTQEMDINITKAGKVEGMELLAFDTKKDILSFIQNDETMTDIQKAEAVVVVQEGGDGFNVGNVSAVVKENMLRNQRTQIATHEIGHGVFNAIFKNNPEAFIPVANQLLLTTKKLDKKLYNKLAKNIDKVGTKFDAQEVVSRFLEAVSSGDISFAEKKNSFLSGLFGSMIQREFIEEYDFDFKGQTDMFNFVVGLGKKIKEGTLTLKEMQEASESIIATAEVNAKDFKNVVLDNGNISFSKAKVAEVQAKINALEDQYDSGEIDDYAVYENTLENLEKELEKAKAIPESETVTEAATVKKEPAKKETTGKEPRSKGNLQNLLDTKYEGNQKRLASEGLRNTPSGSVTNDFSKSIIGKELGGAVETITRRLYDPIAADAKRNVTRDEYKDALIQSAALLINNEFDASKQTLDKFISSRLNLRANALAYELGIEGATKGGIKKDAAEEKGLMADETADQGFTETVKEKPKYKNALEAKVFTAGVLETAIKKIITITRTLKNRIDAPVSLNKTVTPLISEIKDEVGKQLDIDIKTMLGGKKDGVLVKELLRTKRYVLENMTTTWLMGKDGQGGIPMAIQKQIDGKWVNFPDWVGKKIDREKTTTDQAGRTSGAELVRRLPNVANNISDEVFLAQIIGPDGNPIRGRKESLSKAMSEEGALDIINADLADEGPIFEALATNQERLGYEMANNFAITFSQQSERGNIKFSKAMKEAQDVFEKLDKNVKFNLIGANGSNFTNFIRNVNNEDEVERLFNIAYEDISFEAEDRNKIVNAIKGIYSFYKKQSGKSTAKTYGIKLNEDFESFANRKIFNALSKDQSLALTVNIPSSDLKWKSKTERQVAQKHMKNFYNSAIKNFTENKKMSRGEAQKLFTRLFSRAFSYGKDQSLFDNQEGFFDAFLNKQPGFTMGAGEIRGRTIKYNGEKVNSNIGEYGQATSAKDISEFIKTGNTSKINIKERKAISAAAKKDLKTLVTALKEMYENDQVNDIQLGLIFKSLGGSMNSPLKLASELRYVAEKGNYSSDTKEWIYEHVPPSSYISRIALGIITGKTKTTIDEFMDKLVNNSYVTILPKSFDKSVNELYKSNMPFYYEIGDNPLIRYLDAGFNGKETPAFYDLYDKKPINNAVVKDAFSSKIIKDTQEAVTRSLYFSKAPKGISVFDFDDTSAFTSGSVLYTMPDGSKGKLNAEEFAKEGGNILDNGGVFDFSEFSKVVDGKPGPMVEKMKKMIAKFGNENFFILTARPANAALPIKEFLDSIGIDIPLENITGLGNSAAQAKADWMVTKAAEGYNDFYFADDAIQNVEAVKNALDVLDVKSKIQQAKIKFSKAISPEFNKIISKNTGIGPAIEYSDIVAKRKGANKNLFDLYVPASAADFELLLYNFLGKGAEGEAQMKFFSDALLKPYANGNDLMDAARQSIKNNYKELIKAFPGIAKKLEKLTPDGNFTYDQALRVAMWNGSDVEIPGLSKRDTSELTSLVNNDTELYDFMSGLVVLGRQGNGWVKPGENWDASTIISDLHNLTEGDGRKQFLAEFIDNAQEMFGKWDNGKLVGPNINKVEAIYGTDVRESIEDVLYRMTTGKNRSQGKDKITNKWLDWVSGSTGTIMFLNTRSAALQLIGAVNFLNLRDNNPIAAGAAFANQPQYWADFARIWNSDKMKERRGGLKEDVAAAEIANAAATSRNKPTAVVSYLLKIGYTPTQLADSFAIASGGAPFYRNRIKSYLKEGLTEQEAEAAAWSDFTKVSDETQQSGDPRDISKQQASGAGRLLLTFQNTAMQQSRIVKKSFLDLKNGRGDAKTHIAKIAYYLAIQNLMFSVLQQGLFAVLFHDEDEEDEVKKKRLKEKDKKIIEVASGVVDSVVRGTGLLGGVLVTLKNVIKKYMEEEPKGYKADYTKVVLEATNISPPIGSKVRKIYSGLQQTKFDKDLIKERGWGVMQDGRVHLGPMYSIVGKGVEATVNFPMERLVNKVENTSQMFNSQNQAWQRVMLGLGWNPRSVGIEETGGDVAIEAKAKEVRKEEGEIKGAETRERTKDSIRALPMVERMRIKREAAIKRREAKIKKRKRKMG
jgi:hypothetical protein